MLCVALYFWPASLTVVLCCALCHHHGDGDGVTDDDDDDCCTWWPAAAAAAAGNGGSCFCMLLLWLLLMDVERFPFQLSKKACPTAPNGILCLIPDTLIRPGKEYKTHTYIHTYTACNKINKMKMLTQIRSVFKLFNEIKSL